MGITTEDIIEFLLTLADDEDLSFTVSETAKGALIAGGCTALGGLLLGPVGLAAGGAIGGCVAASKAKDFKPVSSVIMNMSSERKEILASRVRPITENFDAADALRLATIVASNAAVKERIIGIMVDYMHNEMRLSIKR